MNVKGFEIIMRKIVSNDESHKLTHKEVRAYARCLLKIIPDLNISSNVTPEVEVLLTALSAPGLPHHDRSFLAQCILKLLEENTWEDVNVEF
jgi:hypothetical protein